jgi:hypothetical protein
MAKVAANRPVNFWIRFPGMMIPECSDECFRPSNRSLSTTVR